MQKVIILGGGMVGSAIAADLSTDYDVTVADNNETKLHKIKATHSLNTLHADISSNENINSIVKEFDLVVGAAPGFMGFNTLKSVIEARKNIVDISFFSEDPFELDSLAKENDLTAIVDCGIAPGFSNIILGYHSNKMKTDNFECYVGGLPFKRTLPFQYKAPFSPGDVIEEYVRSSRIVRDGKVIIRPALSDPELIEFENIGTLEAFNTDGLRSLIKTMNIPNMIEKTLRYPGHIDLMKILRDTGFFDKEKIEVDGSNIRPVDFTSRLLFPHWKLEENQKEFTILRLIIEGDNKRITYDLFDKFDEETKTTSMARTTGYTCSAVARLVMEGRYSNKGISPPEFIGMQSKAYEFVTDYLNERKISFTIREQEIK